MIMCRLNLVVHYRELGEGRFFDILPTFVLIRNSFIRFQSHFECALSMQTPLKRVIHLRDFLVLLF